VATFDGLTVDAARAHEARLLVRGLRAISDFESEGQLAANNRVLARTSTRCSS
jgi:pantetheine-phosphate adenylyltransferase